MVRESLACEHSIPLKVSPPYRFLEPTPPFLDGHPPDSIKISKSNSRLKCMVNSIYSKKTTLKHKNLGLPINSYRYAMPKFTYVHLF